jgi:hypothetical protein
MLRRKPGASMPVDQIDRELVEGVEAELPWPVLVRSASCSSDEAEQRVVRLLKAGYLEGIPGVTRSPSRTSMRPVSASMAPQAAAHSSIPPGSAPRPGSQPGMSAQSVAPRPTAQPTMTSVVPGSAGEALLRELRTMRGEPSIPAPESIRKPAISSRFPTPTTTTPQAGRYVVDSTLGTLIDELARGQGMQRWASVRLREALEEEVAGNFMQAVAILQVVLAQFEDVRIRKERDRLQERGQQATSGIYRSRAIQAERSQNPKEAADQWRKVLEAQPNDAEAALHAATCLMEAGDLKQAAQFARRAVQLEPNNLQAHKLLYKFFQRTGMEASAAREREIILKLRKA